MGFLPEDYKVPVTSNYMKMETGKNRFRILGSAIVGEEFWVTGQNKEGKPKRIPIRKRPGEKITVDELAGMEEGDKVRHFWVFPVWNYGAERVQVLEITQKRIMGAIQALTSDEDWGDPKGYDISITKEGEGMDTKYAVMPKPGKPIDPGIKQMYKDMHIDLSKLYDGGDPFTTEETVDVDEVAEALGAR